MHDPETGFEGQEESDEFSIDDFYRFREASSRFHEGATELMAAMVRVQMLMLDDAKMTLTEVADSLSIAARNRRASDESQG